MHEILKKHELGKGYTNPRDRESALATLVLYLEGKPDDPGWRSTFAYNKVIPIPHEGKIIPSWALFDYYKLREMEPQIDREMAEFGFDPKNIPSLERVVELLER